ncbi:MAG: hypothetical protein Q4G19_01155 [Clostridia bacterium]|nr:hypothetical protein [Clostridia bacterium]
MKKVTIVTVLLLVVLASTATAIWFKFFRRTSLAFEKVCEFETEWSYRLENGKPYDPMSWFWYTIPSNVGTGAITPYLDEYGIVLDLEKYTYIVTKGYVLDDISVSLWNSEKNDDGTRFYYGHIVVSTDCPPNNINLYRTDKIAVVQNDTDRATLSGVTIKNVR